MNRIIFTLILITLFSSSILTAQSDCSTAFLITSAAPTSYTPTSGGSIDDIGCSSNNQQGCLATGELQSAWYYFEMDPSTPPNSPLGFIISPTTAGDYDFALYGPTTNGVNCSNLGAPISCDYHPNSITGLSNPIANGFQPLINVNAGEGYFLLVSNFSQNNSGFNLIWSEAGSGFFNSSPTPPSPCDLGNNPLASIVACPGDPPVAVNPGSTSGGNGCSVAVPMYSWTGSGAPFLTANNIPNPSMTIPPVPGVYNLSLTIQSGATCMSTENMTVTVATPPVVNILPVPALCTDDLATSLTANPPGGSWSPNAPGGVVNPAALSPGPNIITYDYVDPVSGCTGNGMTTVMVNLPPIVTIPPIPPLCIQDIPNPYAPVANPPGGTWSSEVIGGVLLPQILGAGQTTITYTYTDPITGCTTTEPTTVTVLPQPQVTFVDPGPICAFGMPAVLVAIPPGGTWGPGAPNSLFDPSNLGPGTYPVDYTYADPFGCQTVATYDVVVTGGSPASIQSPYSQNTFCTSEGTQTLIGSPAGGSWSTNAPNGTIDPSALGVGSHTITYVINDPSLGCSTPGIFMITVNGPPVVSINGVGSLCNTSSPVTLTGNPAGGTWSTNAPGGVFDPTGLLDGSYQVTYTFTDPASNCSDSEDINIQVNSGPSITMNGPTSFCANNTSTLTVDGGFANYEWSNSGNTNSITVNAEGTYTVTVTDANGCSTTASQFVAQSANLMPTITPSQTAICNGNPATLSADGGYSSYQWSTTENTPIITVTQTGTYTVTVTDTNNCTGESSFTINALTSPQPIITGNASFCSGETTTIDAGSWTSYIWSDNSTNQTLTVGAPATYSVTVTDANGCTGVDQYQVSENTIATPIIQGNFEICTNDNTTLSLGTTYSSYQWSTGSTDPTVTISQNETITVTVTDANNCTSISAPQMVTVSAAPSFMISGSNTFCQGTSIPLDAGTWDSYLWSDNSTGQTIMVNTPGTYTVTVTNASNCEGTAEIMVDVSASLQPNIIGNETPCINEQNTLDAGGGFASYEWSNSMTTQTITTNQSGTFTVTVTDATGCTGEDFITITPNPVPMPTFTGEPSFCTGETASVDAGTWITYLWSDNSTGSTLSTSTAGTYTVTVTDASNCTGTNEIVIIESNIASPPFSGDTNFCQGGSTVIDAGPGYTSYNWSNGGTSQTNTISTDGTITVTVTNAAGCEFIAPITITENPLPTPTILGSTSFCSGNSTTLDAGAWNSYQWSDNSTDQMLTVSAAGTYTVTVTDFNNCQGTQEVVVVESASLQPNIDGAIDFCEGTPNLLDAGSGFDSYQWSNNMSTQTISPTETGTYTVTVSDASNCTGTGEITITAIPNPMPTITGENSFCQGESTMLDAGAGYTSYMWSNGDTDQTTTITTDGTVSVTVTNAGGCETIVSSVITENPTPSPTIAGSSSFCTGNSTTLDAGNWDTYLWSDNSTNNEITVTQAGTYTVTVTNTNGCIGTEEIDITIDAQLQPSIVGDSEICEGTTASLDAGTWDTYIWSEGSTSQTINPTESGTYTVTVMDASGCMGETSVSVVENTPPNPTIIGATSFCTGNSTIIDAGAFDSYLWSDGSLSQTLEVFISGTYTVVVSDMNGCTGEASIDVSELSSLDPMVTGPNAFCPDDMITLEAAGGFVSYVWSDNSTSATLEVSSGGTYTVTVTDANNCTGEQTVSISQNTPPSPSITGVTEICIGTSTTLDADAGFASYVWSDLSTDVSLEVSQAGIYTVTVTDANGCTGTMEEEVTELAAPNTTITGTPNFCPNESTIVEADAGFSTYIWSDGSTTATTSISVPGTYTVTITDLNGCTNTEEISITENTPPSPTLVGASSFCSGNSTILDATGTYTDYLWSDNSTDPTLEIFISGTYSVTVTDINGCTGTMEQVVTETTSLLPAITGATSFCPNETVMVEAEVGYIDYEWSNLMTTSNIEVTASGTYTVTVTDLSGCTGTNEISIIENTPPTPSIAGSTSFCTGSTSTLDVGNTYDQYLWSDGSTNSTLEVSTDGIYSVTVTDLNGCTGVESVQVIESTQLNPNISGDDSFCTGTSTLLDAGSGFTIYEWSNSSTDQTIDVTTPGTFTVTVTDLSGCTGETSLVVSVHIPVNAGTANAPTNLCGADVSLITLQNELTGADANGQWIETSNTASTGGAFNATMGIFNTDGQSAGTYTFDYFIAGNGTCPDDVETVTVVIEESPVAMISAPANIITCIQSDITLDANGSQGDALQYLWTTIGNGNIVSGNTTATPIIDTEGVYLLTVTSGNGCTATSEISITESITMPDADAGTNQNITCDQSAVTLNGTTIIMNPIFTWTGNGINADNMNLPNPTVDEAGVYTLVVTDANNGCESTPASTTVTTDDNIPTFTLDPVGNLDCINNSQILTGPISPNFAYQWLLNGNVITGATEPNFEAMEPGTYSLVITDNLNGCEGTATLNVMASTDLPTAEAGTADLLTCEAGSVSLNGNGSSTDPNGTFIYSWLDPNGNEIPNSNALSINVDQAGTYNLVVFNTVNGCQSTDFVLVEADGDVPVADAGANTMLDCDFSAIQIGGNSTSGNGITYTWTSPTGGTISNNTIPNPEITEPGIYQLLVTDTNNGCDATDEIIISENNNVPTDAIIEVNPITCFGDSDASIIIGEITGGTAPYEFSLNGNESSNVNQFSFLEEGNYTVQVIDDEGCQWETELFIPEPPEFVLDLGADQTIQLTESTQITAEAISPIQVIEWRPDSTLSCLDCIDPIATPFTTTTYQATASNERGCESTDQITIFVEKNRDVYFPNVFTPNGDGNNDMFYPQSGNIVEKIHVFQVYTRWGEVVYEVKDVLPNDMSIGWDGTFKGQKLNPAVFVYYADVEFIDGLKVILKGDVALRR